MTDHQAARAAIDAHFARRGDDERAMREHLADCAECRRYYERHMMLASLDPQAPSPEERIGSALRIRGARRFHFGWVALAPVAAALAFFVVARTDPGQGFTARSGSSVEGPSFSTYRAGDRRELTSAARRGDELAFTYRNPSGHDHLMVFGVDEHRHVYWFHPAWQDPSQNPTAVPIARTAIDRELPEAIAHPFDGGRLTIFGLFCDRPVSVREVEAAIARDGQPDPSVGELRAQTIELVP